MNRWWKATAEQETNCGAIEDPHKFRLLRASPSSQLSAQKSTSHPVATFSQYIALNSTGAAEGLLYVDDGRSFDYEKGAYVLRRFTFQNGRLECSDAAPVGESAKGFSLPNKIEKIVVMGLPKVAEKRSAFRAILGDTDGKVELESAVEPPVMGSGGDAKALVIKRPWLSVAEVWSVQIVSS